MWNRRKVASKGQTAGYVSRKAAAVRISWVTRRALAVSGHGIADTHRTPFNVFHLIGPVPVTDLLFIIIIIADVDRNL